MNQEAPVVKRDELKRLIDKKKDYVLIDVREKDELEYGMIPTAKNIPLEEISDSLDMNEKDFKKKYGFQKPKKEDNIIFHCRTGGRSERATQFAISRGYKARNYKGSIWDWSEIDANVRRYGASPY